ncbi:hypothetical protein CRUP_019823, partial [Coryphaenoides rupestris]
MGMGIDWGTSEYLEREAPAGERALLEEQARQKEELQLSLEQELQVTASRLNELEQERLLMHQERELLSRQQDAMREQAGPRELRLVQAAVVAAPASDLLEETEKLMKEKVEVQRQAEKDSSDLAQQVRLLEAELEEQVSRCIELEQAQRAEGQDLRQQIQSLEKQLDNNRKFLAEQAVDREHERDVFQQEIQQLEEQLKSPLKAQGASDPRSKEVERLSSQLQEKADWCSELLLGSEQRQWELDDRDREIDTLEGRVRELEQALLASAESLDKKEERRQHDSAAEARQQSLEAQLQTEREALDRKEKEITHLEEQLEQFREELENKSEEAQQLHMQLEIQGRELGSQPQHLEIRESMLQVMEEKDRQILVLNEKLAKLQSTTDPPASGAKDLDYREELIRDLESQVECLRSEQERLKRNGEEELEQLNAVIDKLQQELANIEHKLPPHDEEEVEGVIVEDIAAQRAEDDFATATSEDLSRTKQRLAAPTTDTMTQTEEEAGREEEEEEQRSHAARREDALRERTASLVVLQAQVQALEQSATGRVEELRSRLQELESAAGEKDAELARCQLLLEGAQSEAEALQGKVDHLEDQLQATLASALISRAQLDALQEPQEQQHDHRQTKEEEDRDLQSQPIAHLKGELYKVTAETVEGEEGPGVPELLQQLQEARDNAAATKQEFTSCREQADSLQEELRSRDLAIANLKDQLRELQAALAARPALDAPSPSPSPSPSPQALSSSSSTSRVEELRSRLQELESAAGEKDAELARCQLLLEGAQSEAEALQGKVDHLEDQLQATLASALISRTQLDALQEPQEQQHDHRQTKEEEDRDLQSQPIAHLKGELYKVTAETVEGEEGPGVPELLQQLQEARDNAAATKQEFTSCREQADSLQEELRSRDLAIANLKDQLRELQAALAARPALDAPSPSPSPSPSPQALSSSTSRVEELRSRLQELESAAGEKDAELARCQLLLEGAQSEAEALQGKVDHLEDQLQATLASALISRTQLDALQEPQEQQHDHRQTKEEEDRDLQSQPIAHLKGELYKELESAAGEKDAELARCQLLLEGAQSEAEALQGKVDHLEDQLQATLASALISRAQLDALQEPQEQQHDHRQTKEEEDRDLQSQPIAHLKGELYKVTAETVEGEEGPGVPELLQQLQEARDNAAASKEEFASCREQADSLQEELRSRDLAIANLKDQLRELQAALAARPALDTPSPSPSPSPSPQALSSSSSTSTGRVEELQSRLQELESAAGEKDAELARCQLLLEGAQSEAEALQGKVDHLEDQLQATLASALISRAQLDALQEPQEQQHDHRQTKEEEDRDLQSQPIAHLKGELYKVTAETVEGEEGPGVPELLQQLQEARDNAAASKEEFASCREQADSLQEELRSRDLAIANLKNQLRELQAALAARPALERPSPSPSPSPSPQAMSSSSSTSTGAASAPTQPKRKAGKSLSNKGSSNAKDKAALSRKNSAAAAASQTSSSEKTQSSGGPASGAERQPKQEQRRQVSVADSSTQTHPDLPTTTMPAAAAVVTTETLTLSAAAAQRKKEEEEEEVAVEEVIGEFQEKIAQMQELHAAEILDMEARHISESEALRRDTQVLENECAALKAILDKLRSGEFRDGYTSDSSSDYSHRTGYDPPSLPQEFRTTPDGARPDSEDPLPDKIKTLLREVHQEGMQVLSLSEFPLFTEEQPGGGAGGGGPGWPRERQALLEAVQSLKTLVSQMQTDRGTQTPGGGGGGADWRGDLLAAVQQVLMGERGVLKSALYSQLDELHTSDAILHLNQLEHRLAQQPPGAPGESHAGAAGAQREWPGPGCGDPADPGEHRVLLLEELKGELAQTKLELESTLKAQHKHLKELDALRREVCERSAQLDGLTDQLAQERSRSRELQWALEKE